MRELIDAYFREKSLVGHQLTSFNDFVENRLQRVVDTIVISEDSEPGTVKPEVEDYEIKLGRISVDLPSVIEADGTQKNIFPMEARLRNITYASGVWLEFILYKGDIEINRENLQIGKLPVMIKSDCCILKKESMEKMSSSPRFVQYRYGPEELALAEELSIEEGLSLMKEGATKRMPQARLDDEELARLLKLPGVRAVLTSFEGFPVQNVGEGDFEQIAAMGEDLIRSAGKVAGDIDLGCPESVTLEGTEGYVSSLGMEISPSVLSLREDPIWD